MNAPDRACRSPHLVLPRRRLRLQDRAGRAAADHRQGGGRRCCRRRCWSASRRPTTRPSTRSTTTRRSSRRPISSCRSSTIRSTSARSPPPTRSPTSTRWAARRCSRSRWSACRSTSCRSKRSARSSKAASRSARKAGIPIAGGHTIDSVEPIYGLVAIGLVDPKNLKRNAGARPGDKLVLGKPLGVGVYSAALKKDKLSRRQYAAMIASTTQLNTPGIALGKLDGVHALTDVTGFGLLGHLLEICRGSQDRRAHRLRKDSAASRCSSVRARRALHRRVRPQLDGLRRRCVDSIPASATRSARCSPIRRRRAGCSSPARRRRSTTCSRSSATKGFDRAADIGEIVAGPPRVEVRAA